MLDINTYREEQYQDYQQKLSKPDAIELVKCAGCSDEVEENEVKLFKMHDVNDGKELNYCLTCIEIYKNENL